MTPSTSDISLLLASGGDGRLTLDPVSRLNRYGCGFIPEAGLVQFGSCTGSTISSSAFIACQRLLECLDGNAAEGHDTTEAFHRQLRQRLKNAMFFENRQAVDVVLTPSGTDAEFIPLLLAHQSSSARILNILTAPGEIGSGTVLAAGGRHFDQLTPDGSTVKPNTAVDADLAAAVDTVTVPIRKPDGAVREPSSIDAEIEGHVTRAIESGVVPIIHVVAHSKTGVHAPSLKTVEALEEQFRDRLHVVVDAAQGRISRRGLAEALDHGRIVIMTGSKFYGGPPFSGAVLIPPRYDAITRGDLHCPPGLRRYFTAEQAPQGWKTWRQSLPLSGNIGLLLRWEAAMAEIESYYEISPERRLEVLRAFERLTPPALSEIPHVSVDSSSSAPLDDSHLRLLESKQTVFSFAVHLDASGNAVQARTNGLHSIQQTLRAQADSPADIRRSIQIGQPVVISDDGRAVLRIALGATQVREYASHADPASAITADLGYLSQRLTSAIQSLERSSGA